MVNDRSSPTRTPVTSPPAAAPDVRRLGCLTVTKVAVDPDMSNNCYLLHCSDTDDVVLVDAAAEPERLLELIGDRRLAAVVTTHQHWDHHRALAAVIAAHPARRSSRASPTPTRSRSRPACAVGRRVGDGDTVAVGTCDLSVVRAHRPHARLRSPCCSTTRRSRPHPHLFTGDSLFPGGVGAHLRRRGATSPR